MFVNLFGWNIFDEDVRILRAFSLRSLVRHRPRSYKFDAKVYLFCRPQNELSIVVFLLFFTSLSSTVRRSSSFCSCSPSGGGGEAAPRVSRCFICLSALFITCNLALARARVISYWFSTPFFPSLFRPLRAIASSPPPLSRPTLFHIRFFFLSSYCGSSASLVGAERARLRAHSTSIVIRARNVVRRRRWDRDRLSARNIVVLY